MSQNPQSEWKPRRKKRQRSIPTKTKQQIFELLLTKSEHGLTYKQIGARFGVSHATVAYYSAALAKKDPSYAALLGSSRTPEGRAKRSNFGHGEALKAAQEALAESGEDPIKVAGKFVKEVEDYQKNHPDGHAVPHPRQAALALKKGEGTLSINEMLHFLSDVARTGPPQYKIAAIKLLDELHAVHRPAESFGPPVPLTPEEACSRLIRLLTAVGPVLTITALKEISWLSTSSTNGTTPQWTWTPPAQPLTLSLEALSPRSFIQEDGSSDNPPPTTSSPSTSSTSMEPSTTEESSTSPSPTSSN